MPFQLEKLGYQSISSLTGWLLFAYSAGLAITTLPVAMWSERYNARQWPLILGIILLIGSIIMLMEAPKFWLMVVARVLQGFGSTMVWVVGLALLCDTTPERIVGRQLGFAMSGMSIGFLLGPPVGGALYKAFGFRGVCIFGIIAALIDLVARLIVIERKTAIQYGFDPHTVVSSNDSKDEPSNTEQGAEKPPSEPQEQQVEPTTELARNEPQLSLLTVVIRLLRSTRIVATVICLFVYGPRASAIGGYLTDRFGTPPIVITSLVLSIPWWFVLTIKNLGGFITAFALESALPPLTAELAEVSKLIEGIGCE
ncbi:hypothetical protein VNI00_004621 [Paramarasmius palmivorus]|uniref:Major facilitator superfamily (MFS) profile domain-containing protein n=1 Tax=Paramarasmius palmivorus TaxID=297713 RepID=A0AAW0DJ47_9AGAR